MSVSLCVRVQGTQSVWAPSALLTDCAHARTAQAIRHIRITTTTIGHPPAASSESPPADGSIVMEAVCRRSRSDAASASMCALDDVGAAERRRRHPMSINIIPASPCRA